MGWVPGGIVSFVGTVSGLSLLPLFPWGIIDVFNPVKVCTSGGYRGGL